MYDAPENQYGIMYFDGASDMIGIDYRDRLKSEGVKFTETEFPSLGSFAGNASLIHYISPKRGTPITVFVVPQSGVPDGWGEEYYIFDGLFGLDAFNWADVYQVGRCFWKMRQ